MDRSGVKVEGCQTQTGTNHNSNSTNTNTTTNNKTTISKEEFSDEHFDKLVIETSRKVSQDRTISGHQLTIATTTPGAGQQERLDCESTDEDLSCNRSEVQPGDIDSNNDNNNSVNSISSCCQLDDQQQQQHQQLYCTRLNQPKRPMNAFMVWGQAIRRELHNKFSNVQNAMLSKALGRVWKTLDPLDKEPYVVRANKIKENHKRAYPNYRYQPRRIQEKQRSQENRLGGLGFSQSNYRINNDTCFNNNNNNLSSLIQLQADTSPSPMMLGSLHQCGNNIYENNTSTTTTTSDSSSPIGMVATIAGGNLVNRLEKQLNSVEAIYNVGELCLVNEDTESRMFREVKVSERQPERIDHRPEHGMTSMGPFRVEYRSSSSYSSETQTSPTNGYWPKQSSCNTYQDYNGQGFTGTAPSSNVDSYLGSNRNQLLQQQFVAPQNSSTTTTTATTTSTMDFEPAIQTYQRFDINPQQVIDRWPSPNSCHIRGNGLYYETS